MKKRILMSLCAIMMFAMFTGCTNSSSVKNNSNSNLTSDISSLVEEIKPIIPIAELDYRNATVYVNKDVEPKQAKISIPFSTNVSFQPNLDYYVSIYCRNATYSEWTLVSDEQIDTSKNFIVSDIFEGDNYYRIKFHTNDCDGEFSNSIYMSHTFKPKLPKATLNGNQITFDEYGYINIPFSTNIAFESGVKYSITLCYKYGSNSEWEESTSTYILGENYITNYPLEGDNYYRIRFDAEGYQGEYSEIFHYYCKPIVHKEFKFYTLLGAFWGWETLSGYPDYSTVDNLLRQGITPKTIEVEVYSTCAHCFTETYVGRVNFSYQEGEMKMLPLYYCSNERCRSEGERKIFSSIVNN